MAYEKKICSNCGEESFTGSMYCPICHTRYGVTVKKERTESYFQFYSGQKNLHKYAVLNLACCIMGNILIVLILVAMPLLFYLMEWSKIGDYTNYIVSTIVIAVVLGIVSIILEIVKLDCAKKMASYNMGFKSAYDNQISGIKHSIVSDGLDAIGGCFKSTSNSAFGAMLEVASKVADTKSTINAFTARRDFIDSLNYEFRFVKDYSAIKYGKASYKLMIIDVTAGLVAFLAGYAMLLYGAFKYNMGLIIAGGILTGIVFLLLVLEGILFCKYLFKSSNIFYKNLKR